MSGYEKTQRMLVAAVLGGLSLWLAAACYTTAGATVPWRDIVKIGLVLPFSGHDAGTARNILSAVKLAIADWNGDGGLRGHRIELVALDDESDPEAARYQARELAADPAVFGVIGHLRSDTMLAATDEYRSARLALLALGATADSATTAGHATVLRMGASDSDVGRAVAALGFPRIAAVYAQTPGYRAQAEAVARAATAAGAEVTTVAAVTLEERVFSDLLPELKADRVVLVFYSGDYRQAALLARAVAQTMPDAHFLAGGEADSPDFIRLLDGTLTTAMYISTSAGGSNDAQREFDRRYFQNFGAPPHAWARLAYDAANLLSRSAEQALEEDGELSRDQMVDRLLRGQPFAGISGVVSFDERGARLSAEAVVRRAIAGIYPGEIVSGGG